MIDGETSFLHYFEDLTEVDIRRRILQAESQLIGRIADALHAGKTPNAALQDAIAEVERRSAENRRLVERLKQVKNPQLYQRGGK